MRDPEKYSFRPRELLQEIISTWINLATDPKFLECVATDERSVGLERRRVGQGREGASELSLTVACLLSFSALFSSYRPAVFAKAARILRKRAILAEPSIRRFEELTRTLAALSESMQDLEAILGEIPDEFADQLMGVLMTVREHNQLKQSTLRLIAVLIALDRLSCLCAVSGSRPAPPVSSARGSRHDQSSAAQQESGPLQQHSAHGRSADRTAGAQGAHRGVD